MVWPIIMGYKNLAVTSVVLCYASSLPLSSLKMPFQYPGQTFYSCRFCKLSTFVALLSCLRSTLTCSIVLGLYNAHKQSCSNASKHKETEITKPSQPHLSNNCTVCAYLRFTPLFLLLNTILQCFPHSQVPIPPTLCAKHIKKYQVPQNIPAHEC